MEKTSTTSIFLASLLVAAVQSGFCQGTIYTARSAFETALNSSTTITFEDVPITPNVGVGETTITNSGVTFIGAYMYIRDSATGRYLTVFDGVGPLRILLPGGVTAFGADFSGGIEPFPSYNATLTANLVGGQSYAYNFTGPRGFWTFFGVTFPQPIASLIFDDGGRNVPPGSHGETLDNVTFGSVIPEPGTFCLFGLGALLLGWQLSRKSRS